MKCRLFLDEYFKFRARARASDQKAAGGGEAGAGVCPVRGGGSAGAGGEQGAQGPAGAHPAQAAHREEARREGGRIPGKTATL